VTISLWRLRPLRILGQYQREAWECWSVKGDSVQGLQKLNTYPITKLFRSHSHVYRVFDIVGLRASPSNARPYTSIANVMPLDDQSSKVTTNKEMDDGAAEGCIHSVSGLTLAGSTQTPAPSVLQYPDIPQCIPPVYAGGPMMPSRDPEDLASPPSQVRSVPLPQLRRCFAACEVRSKPTTQSVGAIEQSPHY
jgi:hypothetical protein